MMNACLQAQELKYELNQTIFFLLQGQKQLSSISG